MNNHENVEVLGSMPIYNKVTWSMVSCRRDPFRSKYIPGDNGLVLDDGVEVYTILVVSR